MEYRSHEEYFLSVPDDVRPKLLAIQTTVESLIPGATRCIGYNMPAFRSTRIFFYFAAFKKHIGIYPPVASDHPLVESLARYRGAKGNLAFPLNEALPLALIGRVAEALHQAYAAK